MASNYPASLDSFDTIAADKKTSDAVGGRTHRDMHNDVADALEAVQAELGTDPAGGSVTVKARFDVIEANDWVTSARIAADAVGSSEIAANAVGSSELADNAVDTAAVADSAITTAKIADAAVTAAKFATQPGNLLSDNIASGTDTLSATTGFAGGAATITSSTDTAAQGTRSVKVVTSSISGRNVVGGSVTNGTIPVEAGQTYTFMVDAKQTAGIAATVKATIYWWTSAGNVAASTATSSGTVGTLSSSWQTFSVTATAPADAAFASLLLLRDGAGEAVMTRYEDKFDFHKGAGGLWAMPGVSIVGQSPILLSPNGTRYILSVDNSGNLTTVSI